MKKQQNYKKGAAALEAVIAISVILPVLFSFIFGGYDFYLRQADNVNLNFEAGRYFSTMNSCTEATLLSISSTVKFSQYNLITEINGVRRTSYSAPASRGTIAVYCSSTAWSRGYTFYVWTAMNSQSFYLPSFYPRQVSKGGYYVVE